MNKESAVIDYLTKKGFDLNDGVVTNIVKDQISDLITTGVEINIPGFGKVAKITYLLTTSVNVLNKGMHISQLIKSPKPQVAFTIQNKNYGEPTGYSEQTPNNSVQTSILQTQLTNITQSNVSHIGSASTNFVRNPIQNKVTEQNAVIAGAKPQTIQEKNQYTNGQIIRTPFDITLTWNQNGSTQLDLDSHLATPNGQHVFFQDRGNLNSAPNAFLYRDVISQKGAEQTRVTKLQDGEYRFYIHNYTDTGPSGNTFSPNRLSNFSAQVKIFEGGKPLTNGLSR